MSSKPSPPTNGTSKPVNSGLSLEADIALLTSLLAGSAGEDELDESDPADVAELLRRLDAAEGLADGMEERLDGIMGSLDTLLSDLEAGQEAEAEGEAGAVGSGGGLAAASSEKESGGTGTAEEDIAEPK